MKILSSYFTVHESEQYTFYRVPKALITGSGYKTVTAEAKLLYGLLLDRMGLSVKNGWADGDGLVYIYFTVGEVMESLGCGHEKAGKLFAELERVALIDRRKQGQGRPTMIYVKKFVSDSGEQEVKKSGNQMSANPDSGSQDIRKPDANKTNIKNTDSSEINPSINTDEMEGMLREQIEYDILMERTPEKKERVDEMVGIMVDALCKSGYTIRISDSDLPKQRVLDRFLTLSLEHIEYVMDCLDNNTTKVRNIRAYLLAALYNAPTTMDSYYAALVNHDLNEKRKD
jgi:hypothetical protein